MSVDQYQRSVNSLDKDIADLEKKKAVSDKKAAEEATKAAQISISPNASASTRQSKMRDIQRHESESHKASAASADYAAKIAVKRSKRNDEYLRLQKEQQREQNAQQKEHDRQMQSLKNHYESRIDELKAMATPQLVIHSDDHVVECDSVEHYDVFISHAWEDKETFVEEFVRELEARDIRVWYDKTQIKWGDSMRKRIDEGLRKSTFGVAILSPSYIAEDKYWTKAELDGLFSLESVNGKMLLPIWHNLTKQQVMDFSPLIANKKALKTSDLTAAEIADEMKALL